MIVYFEDGQLLDVKRYSFNNEAMIVDASCGYTQNKKILDYLLSDPNSSGFIIYTNSIVALDTKYCWDEKQKIPQLHIKDKFDCWKNVCNLTDKSLKQSCNLMKLYMSGEFGKCTT